MPPKKFPEMKVYKLKKEPVKVTVVGVSPLLCNKIPPHTLEDILFKTCGLPIPDRPKPTMEQLYEWSLYRHPDPDTEFGFPARAFKSAMVRTCKIVDGVTMKDAESAFHVLSDTLPLRGTPERFDTHERNYKKQIIAVTYALFPKGWEIDLTILHTLKVINRDSVINLLFNAGSWAGIGRRRPELGGTNGTFEIKSINGDEPEDGEEA